MRKLLKAVVGLFYQPRKKIDFSSQYYISEETKEMLIDLGMVPSGGTRQICVLNALWRRIKKLEEGRIGT